MAVNISKKGLADLITKINEADQKVAEAKGDEKALQAKAHADLVNKDEDYRYVSDMLDAYRAMVTEGEEFLAQMVAEGVAAIRSSSKGDVEKILAARNELVAKAKAYRTVLEGAGEKDLPAIPGTRSVSTGGTSSGGRAVSTSQATYYRVVNGERTNQPATQNTLSSLVWYQSHHVNGKRMSVRDFQAWALKTHKVDVKQAKAWSIKLNDSVTVGMEPAKVEAVSK